MDSTERPFMNPFMLPDLEPEPYRPGPEVVAWLPAMDGRVVVEIFRRTNDAYGFRYNAWVAWRDGGGEARKHSWWENHPVTAVFCPEQEIARKIAVEDARNAGVELENTWRSVV